MFGSARCPNEMQRLGTIVHRESYNVSQMIGISQLVPHWSDGGNFEGNCGQQSAEIQLTPAFATVEWSPSSERTQDGSLASRFFCGTVFFGYAVLTT